METDLNGIFEKTTIPFVSGLLASTWDAAMFFRLQKIFPFINEENEEIKGIIKNKADKLEKASYLVGRTAMDVFYVGSVYLIMHQIIN